MKLKMRSCCMPKSTLPTSRNTSSASTPNQEPSETHDALNDVVLYAATNGGGYAGKFYGNVEINGTLSKSAGTFKIDHPLDPENKYLYHSFVESPDMMNVYNGNVLLDNNGEAVVKLSDWFEALNMEFRYQL